MGSGTPGFSGADLANMVNEAALAAARQNRKGVLMLTSKWPRTNHDGSRAQVAAALRRRKKEYCYHEAGHALVAAKLAALGPGPQVTIIPRGMALGLTQQLPVDDRHNYYKITWDVRIAILMGGRLAEEAVPRTDERGGRATISSAPQNWRVRWSGGGMSQLGPLTSQEGRTDLLGREIAQHRDYSELPP